MHVNWQPSASLDEQGVSRPPADFSASFGGELYQQQGAGEVVIALPSAAKRVTTACKLPGAIHLSPLRPTSTTTPNLYA